MYATRVAPSDPCSSMLTSHPPRSGRAVARHRTEYGPIPGSRWACGSVARRVPDGDTGRNRRTRLPARRRAGGVVEEACDLHVGVTGVGVDRDPVARAGVAPPLEAGGVERRV